MSKPNHKETLKLLGLIQTEADLYAASLDSGEWDAYGIATQKVTDYVAALKKHRALSDWDVQGLREAASEVADHRHFQFKSSRLRSSYYEDADDGGRRSDASGRL
jgi:hypothetical protein